MKKVGVQMSASSPCFEERAGDQVNRFVHAIGQEQLIALEAEVLCDDSLNRLSLRIDRQTFGRKLLQSPQDSWTRAEGVLIEIEAQSVATCERRMILGHCQDGLARLNQCCLLQNCAHLILTRTLSAWPTKPSASASAIV